MCVLVLTWNRTEEWRDTKSDGEGGVKNIRRE